MSYIYSVSAVLLVSTSHFFSRFFKKIAGNINYNVSPLIGEMTVNLQGPNIWSPPPAFVNNYGAKVANHIYEMIVHQDFEQVDKLPNFNSTFYRIGENIKIPFNLKTAPFFGLFWYLDYMNFYEPDKYAHSLHFLPVNIVAPLINYGFINSKISSQSITAMIDNYRKESIKPLKEAGVDFSMLGGYRISGIIRKLGVEVIRQNLTLAGLGVVLTGMVAYYCKKYHPLKIQIVLVFAISFFVILLPYFINNVENLYFLFLLQLMTYLPLLNSFTNLATWFKYFPVQIRFSSVAICYGVGTALGYSMTSFGLILLSEKFGHYGLWGIYIPVIVASTWGLSYLKKLKIKKGCYNNYPDEDFPHGDTAGKEEDYEYENLDDEYEPFSNKCRYSEILLSKLEVISKRDNKKLNVKLIEKAVTFAKRWHGIQMRKTGEHPFYWHPLKVAEMVAERYCKTDVIVAAILHDVVEDSECTVKIIEKVFNARIAQIVDRLTKSRFENGEHIELTLEETLDKLQEVGDIEALLIKQIDRAHNLETVEGLKPDKQNKMAEESNNYFVKLISIIGDKLGIHGKVNLENKMFKLSNETLTKNKRK
jgi:hypothetical protein